MKINKIKINGFGKIKEKELELGSHINVIYGKNESGKSTILKCIVSLLYGIAKNKNGKTISDQEKYTPWNQEEFSAKLQYELENGEHYEVYREFKKKNPIIYNAQLEDISHQFTIDKNKGNEFFEEQTGIDKELFCSTIVTEQGAVQLEEKEQSTLVQKISNRISSGEDAISYQKCISNLNKRQLEEIGSQRSQDRPINIIERRMHEIQKEQEELQKAQDIKSELEKINQIKQKQLVENTTKIEILKQIKQIKEQDIQKQEKQKITKEIQKEYEQKMLELKEKIQQIEQIEQADSQKRQYTLVARIILLTIALLCLVLLKIKWIGIGLLIVTFSYLLLKGYLSKKQKKTSTSRQDTKKMKIGQVTSQIEQLEKQISEVEQSTQTQVNLELETIANTYPKQRQEILNWYTNLDINKQLELLQEETNQIKIELNTMALQQKEVKRQLEYLSELEEEHEELRQEYTELMKYNDTINLAKEEIEKAYIEMKETVTPKFTQNLSNIISRISNGKYQKVNFDEQKGIIVETEKGSYILAENLSMGTVDQLYLALRLGAVKEIETEPLPILLDEAFAYYDEERLENILQFLDTEYANRQIIILTCTNREKQILQRNNVQYQEITL